MEECLVHGDFGHGELGQRHGAVGCRCHEDWLGGGCGLVHEASDLREVVVIADANESAFEDFGQGVIVHVAVMNTLGDVLRTVVVAITAVPVLWSASEARFGVGWLTLGCIHFPDLRHARCRLPCYELAQV